VLTQPYVLKEPHCDQHRQRALPFLKFDRIIRAKCRENSRKISLSITRIYDIFISPSPPRHPTDPRPPPSTQRLPCGHVFDGEPISGTHLTHRQNTTPPDQAHSPAASIVKLKNSSKAVAALFGVNEKSIPGAHGPRKPSVSTPCAARGTPRGSDARTEARTPDRGSKLKKHPCTQSTNSFSSGATGTSTLRNRSLTIGSKQFRASMLPMLCELKHSPH
jgi:hypothetical protein